MKEKEKIIAILQAQYRSILKLSLSAEDLKKNIDRIQAKCDEHNIPFHYITLGRRIYQRAKELKQID